MDTTIAISELERSVLAEIPLARAMQLTLREYDGEHLTLAAPLSPNINDKGCAFGGSLISVMTLAGWGLVVLKLREISRECDVYVQDSNVRYLAPMWSDFIAVARLASGESWESFEAMLKQKGRTRATVDCRVPLAEGGDACTMQARFVAVAR
jgi:thioesterase domain-containing protein